MCSEGNAGICKDVVDAAVQCFGSFEELDLVFPDCHVGVLEM